jgi:heme oxygenase
MTPKEYLKLKQEVESLQREVDRSAGRLQSLKERLKKEHGCSNLKAAQLLLKKLEKQEREQEKKINRALADFEHRWDEKLIEQDLAEFGDK